MTGSRIPISLWSIALATSAFLVHTSSAFWWTNCHRNSIISYQSLSPSRSDREIYKKRIIHNDISHHSARTIASARSGSADDDTSNSNQQSPPMRRREATIRLKESGKEATLVSRTIPVFPNGATITVWEWKNSAKIVNAYWDAQGQIMATANRKPMLDPFGLVLWPGSVLAARELYQHAEDAVVNKTVVVFGAGVGVETQAAAMLAPKRVIATDIHPTTLQQLEYGVAHNDQIPSTSNIVETQVLDLFLTKNKHPIPPCDLLVVADVLYSEQLASQVCRRCAEALEANPSIKILITDSQRFVPTFIRELNENLARVAVTVPPPVATWNLETMKNFEGSGVIIDEDQTYDIKVQSLWIGL